MKKQERMTITCPNSLTAAFKQACKEQDKSASQVLREFMRDFSREWAEKREDQFDAFAKLK